MKIVRLSSFSKKYFGEDLPLKVRFFNIVFFGGFFAGLLSTITCMLISSPQAIKAAAVWTVFMPAMFFFANHFNKYYDRIVLISFILLNFLFMPMIYLTGGGIDCGLPSFFVLGIVFTMVFIEGRLGLILAALEAVFYLGVFAVSYYFPQFVIVIPGEKFTYEAIGSNAFLVALTMGLIAKSIFSNYKKEKKVVSGLLSQLEDLSIKDPLTATFNRRYMVEYLQKCMREVWEKDMPLSVLLLDIDKFKVLNDTYGHLVGDEVLINLSALLKSLCRENDIVSRYGGEEFLIIFSNTDLETVKKRAEKIRDSVEKSRLSASVDKKVTVSGGIGVYRKGMTSEELISIADANLYKAKNTGRNQICVGE